MEVKSRWSKRGYCWATNKNTGCHDTRLAVSMWHFPAKCSDKWRWFSRLVQMWAKPRVLPAVHPPCVGVALYPTLTFVAVARRWPFFCPCHALVLNTNAMVLCARHSWEQAVLFLATCPQLHISIPGANGQLVFVSNGERQCRNLPNTNRHLDKSCLCPVLKPCGPCIHLSLCRCREALLPNICCHSCRDLLSHTIIHGLGWKWHHLGRNRPIIGSNSQHFSTYRMNVFCFSKCR